VIVSGGPALAEVLTAKSGRWGITGTEDRGGRMTHRLTRRAFFRRPRSRRLRRALAPLPADRRGASDELPGASDPSDRLPFAAGGSPNLTRALADDPSG